MTNPFRRYCAHARLQRDGIRTVLVRAPWIVVFVATLAAQAPQSFDVVSIKPRTSVLPFRVALPTAAQVLAGAPPDQFARPDANLMTLINDAYRRFPYEVVGGPDWIRSKRWEVMAKTAEPVSSATMRVLVQRMLENRFALKTHVEPREQSVFRLTLSRSDGRLGPKIKEAALDCRPFLTGTRPMAESPKDSYGFPRCSDGVRAEPADANGVFFTPRLNGQPVSSLVRLLEGLLGRHVIDDTRLQGLYDIEFSYPVPVGPPTIASGDEPLFTLLQEQLGMRLVGGRAAVDVLVIDSAQEPTPN
jgi:uncharacterized protein (TIGR03435 family)